MSDEFERDIQLIVRKWGAQRARRALTAAHTERGRPLVVVANGGSHPLPEIPADSEVFYATMGSLDFSSEESVVRILDDAIEQLRVKLHSDKWGDIYLVPFGHTVISSTIKLAIFRLSGKTTIDMFHAGDGRYYEIAWNLRSRLR